MRQTMNRPEEHPQMNQNTVSVVLKWPFHIDTSPADLPESWQGRHNEDREVLDFDRELSPAEKPMVDKHKEWK